MLSGRGTLDRENTGNHYVVPTTGHDVVGAWNPRQGKHRKSLSYPLLATMSSGHGTLDRENTGNHYVVPTTGHDVVGAWNPRQ